MKKWKYGAKEVEYLQLELTSFCNLRCPGCARTTDKTTTEMLNTSVMQLSQIKEWFNKNTLPSLKKISFCGQIDEPASHPEIFEICQHFSYEWEEPKKINFSTNGSLKTKSFWSRLGQLSKNTRIHVEFALDGLEDTYDIYRVGGKYSKVIENAQSFIDAGGEASWKFISFNHNEHQVEEAKSIAKKMGFHVFTAVKSARKATSEINTNHNFEEQSKINCRSFNDKWLFVNYDGTMNPCCYFGFEHRNKNPLDSRLEIITIDEYFKESEFLTDLMEKWDTESCHHICDRKCSENKKDEREALFL